MNANKSQKLKGVLGKLPGVLSVSDIRLEINLIERVSFNHESWGALTFHRLRAADALAMFYFYFNGLSEEARNLFPPYPLFSPPVTSEEELAARITDWQKEDDWTFLLLTKDGQIIGVCLLKRWSTGRPTSGLAVHEEFRKTGLGFLLQTIANEQARLLGLKTVWATVAPDNIASLKVHLKCGFKKTGRMVPHYGYKNGIKVIDRHDVELVRELDGE